MEYNFDEIKSYDPEQVPAALARLTEEKAFMNVLGTLFPLMPKEHLKQKLLSFKTSDEFQAEMVYPFLKYIEANMTTGVEISGLENIDTSAQYLFISNHRDIILDSAFLGFKFLESGLKTMEIAIGDNLLIMPWIEDLVRVNKSFIVQRGISVRKILESSQRLSAYMRYAMEERKHSIWIAQREGRAKDSDDRTQQSLLKMLNMDGRSGNLIDNLRELNIVPVSISYEYDPCDYLKAKEFQQFRDNPEHVKSQQDDLLNMQTGVMGYKGKVHFHLSSSINDKLDGIAAQTSKRNEQIRLIAELIDREIHRNYNIKPGNKIAYDRLTGTQKFTDSYSEQDVEKFDNYLDKQTRKVDLENKDRGYLEQKILGMYANPLINQLAALDK